MGTQGKLKRVEYELIKDLEETTLSFRRLGKKYRVSRQAIFGFCRRKGIERPTRGHTPETCTVCKDLIKIANKPYSDFISYQTIKEKLSIGTRELTDHINILRKNGIISQRFGRLRSKRVEMAYQIYFKEKLSVRAIGFRVGLKNFRSVIGKNRVLGWNVPAPLFTYDSNDRRDIRLKLIKRKRRGLRGQ
jgi:hypothetical protein